VKDLDTVYRQHAQTVYKFLLSQCRDPQTAEELTQETFYQAVRSIDRFDGSCKVSVWLCQIAKHLWYQHLRKANRETELPEEAELPLVPSAESAAPGIWIYCGRSTSCRSRGGRWSTSGPSVDCPSGRLETF